MCKEKKHKGKLDLCSSVIQDIYKILLCYYFFSNKVQTTDFYQNNHTEF